MNSRPLSVSTCVSFVISPCVYLSLCSPCCLWQFALFLLCYSPVFHLSPFQSLPVSPRGMFLVFCPSCFYWFELCFWLYFVELLFLVFVLLVFALLGLLDLTFWILFLVPNAAPFLDVFFFLHLALIQFQPKVNKLTNMDPADTSPQLLSIWDNVFFFRVKDYKSCVEMLKAIAIFKMKLALSALVATSSWRSRNQIRSGSAWKDYWTNYNSSYPHILQLQCMLASRQLQSLLVPSIRLFLSWWALGH